MLAAKGPRTVILCEDCALTLNCTSVQQRAKRLSRLDTSTPERLNPSPEDRTWTMGSDLVAQLRQTPEPPEATPDETVKTGPLIPIAVESATRKAEQKLQPAGNQRRE